MLPPLSLALMLVAPCVYNFDHMGPRTQAHMQTTRNSSGDFGIHWETDRCRFEFSAQGHVYYTNDGRDIARLSPGGRLTVLEASGADTLRVEFSELVLGLGLNRTFTVNGMEATWDRQAADWFAEALAEVDRQSGQLAQVRFPMLMAAGGASAVVSDISYAQTEAKHAYMHLLAADMKLDPSEGCRVASLAAQMNTETERNYLIEEAVGELNYDSPTCRDAFFDAINSLIGDKDKAHAIVLGLTHIYRGDRHHDAFVLAAITAAQNMASDGPKAEVLEVSARFMSNSSALRTTFLDVARTIGSDQCRAAALKALVVQQ